MSGVSVCVWGGGVHCIPGCVFEVCVRGCGTVHIDILTY